LVVDLHYGGVAFFDESKMCRVIHNLARNALQAQTMAGAGVFQINVAAQDGELVFDFKDAGPGIAEELQGRLFEVFATAGKADGTGLGLAIVKKIIDEHHGRITYDSAPGVGTTFRIALPLERESDRATSVA